VPGFTAQTDVTFLFFFLHRCTHQVLIGARANCKDRDTRTSLDRIDPEEYTHICIYTYIYIYICEYMSIYTHTYLHIFIHIFGFFIMCIGLTLSWMLLNTCADSRNSARFYFWGRRHHSVFFLYRCAHQVLIGAPANCKDRDTPTDLNRVNTHDDARSCAERKVS